MIVWGDNLVSGDKNTALAGNALYVRDGKIAEIGTLDELSGKYPDEKAEGYPGCALMPGMIDLHVHLSCVLRPDYNLSYNAAALRTIYTVDHMKKTLAAGVTTIRDSASADGIGAAIIKASADGYLTAPRVFACLQGICMTGGHGASALAGACIEADGADEIRKAVRTNLKNGANCIKVLTSEGYRGQELNAEELKAAADEAHRFGVKIAAHAGYGESIQMCIDAGFDSIEHGTHLTVEQAEYMRDHNMTWVPTVLVFNFVNDCAQAGKCGADPSILRQKPYLEDCVKSYEENVRKIYDTGVRVATGTDTDCAGYDGASPVAIECEYLMKCGLTSLEAIECATKNGADFLGMGDSIGQLKEGYIADFIAVCGDPTADIKALRRVEATYLAGKRV